MLGELHDTLGMIYMGKLINCIVSMSIILLYKLLHLRDCFKKHNVVLSLNNHKFFVERSDNEFWCIIHVVNLQMMNSERKVCSYTFQQCLKFPMYNLLSF